MVRLFELFLVAFIILLLSYFLLYKFVFSGVCNSKREKSNNENIIFQMASCKDNMLCKLHDISYDRNEVSDWNCSKRGVDKFEGSYYKGIFIDYKNKFLGIDGIN